MNVSHDDCKVEFHRNRETGKITRMIYQPSDKRPTRHFDLDCITPSGLAVINHAFEICGVNRFTEEGWS